MSTSKEDKIRTNNGTHNIPVEGKGGSMLKQLKQVQGMIVPMLHAYLGRSTLVPAKGEPTALRHTLFEHLYGPGELALVEVEKRPRSMTYRTWTALMLSNVVAWHNVEVSDGGTRKMTAIGATTSSLKGYRYYMGTKDVKDDFLRRMKARIIDLYGYDASLSPDYGRMVNQAHFDRVAGLIDETKVFYGGGTNREDRFIAPTIMTGIDLSDRVMQEEIFGPVLPVMTYNSEKEIIRTVSQLPQHPLAFYVFSESKSFYNRLISRIPFGGGCINHCVQHLVNPHLPFGGKGESGMGNYHGFSGFETFSHKKSVLKAATWFDLNLLYPPYKKKVDTIRRIFK